MPSDDPQRGHTSDTDIASEDETLMQQADADVAAEKWLASARLLRKVKNTSLLTERHLRILGKAEQAERLGQELTREPGDEWIKQGESHGAYDTVIYYKVVDSNLTARIETPISQSLLVPLLSVFNETDLYTSWLPSWEKPRLGVRKCEKLRQDGRCNQLILATTDIPWPLATRECLIDIVAIDEIEENGAIIVQMDTLADDHPDAPEKEKDSVRISFHGGILFRKCPENHAAFIKSKHARHGSDMVLVCIHIFVDPRIKYVPHSLMNFSTRIALGSMWHSTLKVAEDVRDGRRPEHAEAIASKREALYDFIDERIRVMLFGKDKKDDG